MQAFRKLASRRSSKRDLAGKPPGVSTSAALRPLAATLPNSAKGTGRCGPSPAIA